MSGLDLVKDELLARLVKRVIEDRFDTDCELVGFSGSGRCIEPAVAARWESDFLDLVCKEHAVTAEDRGALVVLMEGVTVDA